MTMSADGFFCGPNGELDWMSQVHDKELNDDDVAFFRTFDQGFIGYPTAIGMIPYWQNVAQSPEASEEGKAIANAVLKLNPYIVSKKEETLPWKGNLLVAKTDEELVVKVNQIKKQPGKDLGIPGGIRTAQTFVRLGLVDECMLRMQPVAIGKGKRVFEERKNLKLVSVKRYNSGIVRLHYRMKSK